jgi:uncharacterized protein (TIGR03435 family)
MRQPAHYTFLIAVLAAGGHGQTFEVASIKVLPAGERRADRNIEATPGNLTIRNMGLGPMIGWAYKISAQQVTNPEAVTGGETYDIVAKAAGPAKSDELRTMLKALLAERFKMAAHRETKEMTVYTLLEAKGGHKLKESTLSDGVGVLPVQAGKMALKGVCATLDQLAMFLSSPLRTPVVDLTGLKGKYDFEFDLTNFVRTEPAPGEQPPDPVAILQLALPQQLGLRLAARKMPIEMLVIDHIEKTPVAN